MVRETVRAQARVSLKDGVNAYSVRGLQGRAVRARFELLRQPADAASPIVDGFRLVGMIQKL